MPSSKDSLKVQLRSEPDSESLPCVCYPNVPLSPHVHFPPTPALTSIYVAHSPQTYDRTPIVISPNRCAFPKRDGSGDSWNICDAYKPKPLISHLTVRPAPSELSTQPDQSDKRVVTQPESSAKISRQNSKANRRIRRCTIRPEPAAFHLQIQSYDGFTMPALDGCLGGF